MRGPNIFPGYWNRPDETAKFLRDGWFHTGDQGEVDANGNWKIVGRIKNLLILGSGHNIAPEPIEDEITQELPRSESGRDQWVMDADILPHCHGQSEPREAASGSGSRESWAFRTTNRCGPFTSSRSRSQSKMDC